jgi:tetratricopeptide (TPR) repeat protein
LTKAVQLDPTLVQANLVRAEVSIQLGNLKEARGDLTQIENQYKDSSRYHLINGDLLVAEGNSGLAISEYDLAIQLSNANVEAYVNRGAIHYQNGAYGNAKEDFLRALTIDPSQTQALNNLGLIYVKAKNWQKALAYFDRVLAKYPDDPYSLNNKGFVLLQTEHLEQAKSLVEKSLEKLPENAYAIRNLGLYYQYKGNLDEASSYYAKAIDIAQPVEMLYGLAGQVLFQQNRKEEACKIWQQGKVLRDSLSMVLGEQNCH